MSEYTADQIVLMRRVHCPKATDDEFEIFKSQVERTGLDPFARQIYAVGRWDSRQKREVLSVQTSIDGFRLIAERTGKYAGQRGPEWCGPDGVWVDVWIHHEPPVAARVAALRHDFAEPCWGVARFDSYAGRTKSGELSMFWKKMPDLMIAKVAEALALRKAFPQELSGLYTSDEMQQATSTEDAKPTQEKSEKKYVAWHRNQEMKYVVAGTDDHTTNDAIRELFTLLRYDLENQEPDVAKKIIAANLENMELMPEKGKVALEEIMVKRGLVEQEEAE